MTTDAKVEARDLTERERQIIDVGLELDFRRGWQYEAARRLGVSRQAVNEKVVRMQRRGVV